MASAIIRKLQGEGGDAKDRLVEINDEASRLKGEGKGE